MRALIKFDQSEASKSKMVARGPKNGRRGLERVLACAAALQSVAVRQSTDNDVSGHYFHRYFLFFLFFFLSPSSIFLIEGVLRSRNLFSESGSEQLMAGSNNLRFDLFRDPVGHF